MNHNSLTGKLHAAPAASQQNSSVEDPEAAQKIEFLQSIVKLCQADIVLLEEGEEITPKTILVSEHFENGSQTRIMQNATIRHMCNAADSLLSKIPPQVQFGFLMEKMKGIMEGGEDA